MSVVAVISGAELNTDAWEVCHRGYSLAFVPTKYLRVSVDDSDRVGFWRGRPAKSASNYTVSVAVQNGKYDGRKGVLLLLSETTEEPTDTFVIEEHDRGTHFEKAINLGLWSGLYPMLSQHPDIDPRRQLWWSWKHWYCNMVDANAVRDVEAQFIADCESLHFSVTARNRAAGRLLYKLAREAGWRQLGGKFAALLGLKKGAWITDEEFHRAGASVFPDWARKGVGQFTEEAANPDA